MPDESFEAEANGETLTALPQPSEPHQETLFTFSTSKKDQKTYGAIQRVTLTVEAASPMFTYPLRTDIIFPRRFKRAVVSLEQQSILDDLAGPFSPMPMCLTIHGVIM